MMCDTPCRPKQTLLQVDEVQVVFSLASKGTKVSIHALHALLGLTT